MRESGSDSIEPQPASQTGEVFDDIEPQPTEEYLQCLTEISQASVQTALALRKGRGKYGLVFHSGNNVREINSTNDLLHRFLTTLEIETKYYIDHDAEYKDRLMHLHNHLGLAHDDEHKTPHKLIDKYLHCVLSSMDVHFKFFQSNSPGLTHDALGVESFFELDDVSIDHLWKWYQQARSKIVTLK